MFTTIAILAATLNPVIDPASCTEARRLDGLTVVHCDGRRASIRDDHGNARVYLPNGTILVITKGRVTKVGR